MKKINIVLFLVVFVIGLNLMLNEKKSERDFIFGTVQLPFSGDPLDYDYYIHHYAFTSVLSGLVSVEKNAEIVPVLAEKWSSDENFKIWKFKFRSNLTYSNGDVITLDDYIKNLKRICFLKKKRNSNSGVLEFLNGFENIKEINDEIEGIKSEGGWLTLSFSRPMPDLLAKISFGFYSLAHPSLYDEKTGEWKKQNNIIASGPYEVLKWDKNNFELSLRKGLPYVDYNKRIQKVIFKNFLDYKTAKEMQTLDVLFADRNTLMVNESFEFVGSDVGLKIGYVRCNSWNKKGSPLSSASVRRWFREKFLEGLNRGGLKPVYTFFPTSLLGVKPILNEAVEKPSFQHFEILTHTMSFSGKIVENQHKKGISEIFQEALANIGNNSGASLIQDDTDYTKYDVEIKGTGIELEDYMDTVRFMFLSKEGIKLPDENGKILAELAKHEPDINVINKEIFDQAIIWPIRHYSSGLWFNRKSNIDYSEVNFNSPAIDFQFLKWN